MPIYRINGRNVLFIHVPKTGGTTVESFLRGYGCESLHNHGVKLLQPVRDSRLTRSLPMQHFHGELLEGMFAPGFFDYAFLIVRDPLDRMQSEYRHSVNRRRREARLPFDHWLAFSLAVSDYAPNRRNNHFRPQADFLCLGAEAFRFEEGMGSILRRVSERLGMPAPSFIPHERRSERLEMSVSAASRARVRRAFAADYECFGY